MFITSAKTYGTANLDSKSNSNNEYICSYIYCYRELIRKKLGVRISYLDNQNCLLIRKYRFVSLFRLITKPVHYKLVQ